MAVGKGDIQYNINSLTEYDPLIKHGVITQVDQVILLDWGHAEVSVVPAWKCYLIDAVPNTRTRRRPKY